MTTRVKAGGQPDLGCVVLEFLQGQRRGKLAVLPLAQDLRVERAVKARMSAHPPIVAEPDMVDDQDERIETRGQRPGIGDESRHARAVFVAGAERLRQRVDNDQARRDARAFDRRDQRREVAGVGSEIRRGGYESEGNIGGKIGLCDREAGLALTQTGGALRGDVDDGRLASRDARPMPSRARRKARYARRRRI